LTLLAKGLLYKEIADQLGISYSAVHKHLHKIFEKLQISNRSEAIQHWFWSR
jgi:DNA-binding NarL/FixJ family response regulator